MDFLKSTVFFILIFLFSTQSHATSCAMNYDQIPVYEKQILKILEGKKPPTKNLNKISESLDCLIKMAQEGSGRIRLAVTNSFYALIGGQALPGESEAEMRRFQRSAMLLKALGSKDPTQADFLSRMLAEFLKGEWESYKLFCEKGDISYCLTFLPKESDVNRQDDLVAAASLLKWQIAHTKIDLKQRMELEKRMKNLYEKREQYSILKRWFIEKIYFEMMPEEQPMSMA